MRAFGSWLKQRRLFLGLSQKELALRVGCSPALIRKIEAGERRPSRQIVELLIQPLEISEAESAAFLQFARGRPPPGETTSLSLAFTVVTRRFSTPALPLCLPTRSGNLLAGTTCRSS